VWTFAGNVVYAGCQWAQLSFLAKVGTPEMVGQFALALAVTAPVTMLGNLDLRAVQVTDVEEQHVFGEYLALRLATAGLGLLVIRGMIAAVGYSKPTALVIFVVGLCKAIESISDMFYGLFQKNERLDIAARSMLIKGPLSLLGMVVGVLIGGQVFWGVAGLLAAWTLMLLLFDAPRGYRILDEAGKGATIWPLWRSSTMARLAFTALPLGIVMCLISLNSNIPRYVLERTLGERELGIYSAIAYLVVAGNTVVGALGHSASPKLAKYYAAGDRTAFWRLMRGLLVGGVVLGCGGVVLSSVAGELILRLLYGTEYADHSDVLVIAMVAAGIGYIASFLGYGMTAARRFREQLLLFVVVVAATLLSVAYLVPLHGLLGAALSLLVTSCMQAAGGWAILRHALRRYSPSLRECQSGGS